MNKWFFEVNPPYGQSGLMVNPGPAIYFALETSCHFAELHTTCAVPIKKQIIGSLS